MRRVRLGLSIDSLMSQTNKNKIPLWLLAALLSGVAAVRGQAPVAETRTDPAQFSVPGGVYTGNVSVALSSPTPGAIIRYTLNNTAPTAASAIYSNPLPVSASTVIRAAAFASGRLPSQPAAEAYTLLDTDLVGFTSNLPLLILETYGRSIYQDMAERVVATATVIDTANATGRVSLLSAPDYHGPAGLEGRGQTSWSFPKKPYNLAIRDAANQDRAVSLLGMPADADWVLLNLYNDKTFMNDLLAHELFEKMGHYAVRRRYVEVFLNGTRPDGGRDPSTKVGYNDYVGIYLLLEKIKIGKDRVRLAQLEASDVTEPNITGGYIFKKDKDSPNDVSFTTDRGTYLKFHDPKGFNLEAVQYDWLIGYLNRFEAALYGANWRDPVNGYARYLDVDSFVDYHWIVEFSKQIDGIRLSNYLQKDRDGRIKMEPIWDWNLSFGNADYLEGQNPQGWYWPLMSADDHLWLRRLLANPGDPDFRQKIADRWSELRTNVLAVTNVAARMDELTGLLQEAQARDFKRWPRLGSYVWPNSPGLAAARTHQDAVNWVKNWLGNRYAWIDRQYLLAPGFSLAGGRVSSGATLSVVAPKGAIYYTLDGRDPRQSGGGLAAYAMAYRAPIVLRENARVFARAVYTNAWSGPAVDTFYTRIPSLAITELMYHPAAPSAGPYRADDFQYVELMNTGADTLALTGFHFTRGLEFAFAGGQLTPGQRVVLVKNRAAFESRYGTGLNLGGVFTQALAHGGERLTLLGPLDEPVLDFTYDDRWDRLTDGAGYALVSVNEYAPLSAWGDAANWRRSEAWGGSPGQIDPPRMESVAWVSGRDPGIKLRFNTAPRLSYSLQYRDSLTEGSWHSLAEMPAQSEARPVEITDPVAGDRSARYYRITVWVSP